MLKVTWSVPCRWSENQAIENQRRRRVLAHINGLTSTPLMTSDISSNKLGLAWLSSNNTTNSKMIIMNRNIVCKSSVNGGGGGSLNSWQGWILGVIVTLILPFWRSKWGPFLALKNKVDTLADTVEAVAEVVEDVAETVEKIADEIGNNFPDGGTLRSVFDLVENAARETAKDAHIVDQFIEKVEEMEDKAESAFGTFLTNHQNQSKESLEEVVDEVEPKDSQDTDSPPTN